MKRVSVNVLSLLGFLALWSPFMRAVEGAVCTGSAIGTCTGTQHHADAVCVDGSPTWCKCAAGYTNNAAGVCVVGSKCDGVTCDDPDIHDASEVCEVGSNKLCKCAANHANSTINGECLPGSACNPSACKGGEHTGTCNSAMSSDCICAANYVPVSGTCELDCSPCTDENNTEGTCQLLGSNLTCDCKDGHVHAGYPLECFPGETCKVGSCGGKEYTGTCDSPGGEDCKCVDGYTTSKEVGVMNTCVVGSECDGVACGDTSIHDASGVCEVGGNKLCKCAAGHANSTKDDTCVLGDACTTGQCMDTEHTGTCGALDPVDCLCADGYTKNVDDVCVSGSKCDSGVTCKDMSIHDPSEVCAVGNNEWCKCLGGYANHATSGACVEGAVCTGSAIGTCTGTQHHADAVCVDGNPTWCKCAAGYTNNATGVCVVGSKCDGVTCDDPDIHDASEVCEVGSNKLCKCAANHANSTINGECLPGSACNPSACKGGEHTGTCNSAMSSDCICAANYVPVSGTCELDCSPCTDENNTEGTCQLLGSNLTCDCKDGHVHAGYPLECFPGETCKVGSCGGKEYTGTCDSPGGEDCKCVDGYTTSKEVGVMNTCVVGSECDGVACGDTSIHDASGVCEVGGNKLCKCAAGHANSTKDDTCVLGDACTTGQCMDTEHTGTCGALDPVDCLCADGYTKNVDDVCVSGSKCDSGVTCKDMSIHDPSEVCAVGNNEWCKCLGGYANNTTTGACELAVVDCGSNCDKTNTGYEGTCTNPSNTLTCDCSGDYINSSNPLECVLNCSTCTTANKTKETCTYPGNVITCDCLDGHVHLDPLVCEEDCSSCVAATDGYEGSCDVSGEGAITCTCSDGYVNGAETHTCVPACGTSCDDTANGYTGTCSTPGGTPTCECAANYIHETSEPLKCILNCSTCTSGSNVEATCTYPGDVITCDCKDGYTHDGSATECVDACGGSCVAGDAYTGACTTNGATASCACKEGYKHDSNPLLCVPGDPCEGVTCSGAGYAGNCVQDRGFAKCECEDAYANDANDLTMCTLDCSACVDPNADKTCSLDSTTLTCGCNSGFVNGTPLTCVAVTTTSSSSSPTTTSGAFVPQDHIFNSLFLGSLLMCLALVYC